MINATVERIQKGDWEEKNTKISKEKKRGLLKKSHSSQGRGKWRKNDDR